MVECTKAVPLAQFCILLLHCSLKIGFFFFINLFLKNRICIYLLLTMHSLGKKGQVLCVSKHWPGSGWKPHQGMFSANQYEISSLHTLVTPA